MKDITLTLENKIITLSIVEVDGQQLYNARDLLIGYGMTQDEALTELKHWKKNTLTKVKGSSQEPLKSVGIHSVKGKYGGTYLTQRQVYKLAGYIDYTFEDAVYEAFEAAVNGKGDQAVIIAQRRARVHEVMQKDRPTYGLERLYNDGDYPSLAAFIGDMISLSMNNGKVKIKERVRFAKSMEYFLNKHKPTDYTMSNMMPVLEWQTASKAVDDYIRQRILTHKSKMIRRLSNGLTELRQRLLTAVTIAKAERSDKRGLAAELEDKEMTIEVLMVKLERFEEKLKEYQDIPF